MKAYGPHHSCSALCPWLYPASRSRRPCRCRSHDRRSERRRSPHGLRPRLSLRCRRPAGCDSRPNWRCSVRRPSKGPRRVRRGGRGAARGGAAADKTRVAVTPPAIVRCTLCRGHRAMGARGPGAPGCVNLGAPLRSLDNYAAYDCRGRNRIVGAKLSEHGKANALDVRSVKLANGIVVGLTDPHVGQGFSSRLAQEHLRALHHGPRSGLRRLSRGPRACGPRRANGRPPHVPVGGARARRRSLWRRCRCRCPGRHPPTMMTKTDRS